jgi:ATP-dependent RNA helicase DHX36
MIYYTMVKSSAVFIHDCSMIPPYPLLFFGGDISMLEDEGQEVIAVDHWIKFQAPRKIAELVKVSVYRQVGLIRRFLNPTP